MSETKLGALEAPDPFNPENLKLSQDFGATIDVQKQIITIPVRKNDNQSFFRINPDPEFRINTALLQVKETNENYIVDRGLWDELSGEIIPKTLYLGINRQGVLFLWPVRLPGEDGRLDEWNRSAHTIAEVAMGKWVRMRSNRALGSYEAFTAKNSGLPEPEWPDLSLSEILKIAFRDHYIDSIDHPVCRSLRGES